MSNIKIKSGSYNPIVGGYTECDIYVHESIYDTYLPNEVKCWFNITEPDLKKFFKDIDKIESVKFDDMKTSISEGYKKYFKYKYSDIYKYIKDFENIDWEECIPYSNDYNFDEFYHIQEKINDAQLKFNNIQKRNKIFFGILKSMIIPIILIIITAIITSYVNNKEQYINKINMESINSLEIENNKKDYQIIDYIRVNY